MADATEQFLKFKQLITTDALPSLGPAVRPGTAAEKELLGKLDSFFTTTPASPTIQPLLRSAALLWHDHLDASHTISQGIETREGSWLHGIMHRREPDYGNAKYWFHRVGNHPAFPELARRAAPLLEGEPILQTRLIVQGAWQPFAFIDECQRAEQGNGSTDSLRALQAAEFDVLIEHIFQNV
jgi:hypothetical protein